ncbi:hypothetical protein WMF20_39745 [Sorangium sp. So ce834]|uniref:hypothetical protein n=1 Tax=Sorangium sp. So ce834 TaxID=3133321 RepID=UPI003F60B168
MLLLALLTCSVPDDGASARGPAWIASVGPGAGAIEGPYTGTAEAPRGSEAWEEDEQLERWFARESVVVIHGEVVDHEEILARRRAARREADRNDLPGWLSRTVSETMRGVKVLGFKISDWAQGVRCGGKRFMSARPAPAGHCPDGAEDCEDAPPR